MEFDPLFEVTGSSSEQTHRQTDRLLERALDIVKYP